MKEITPPALNQTPIKPLAQVDDVQTENHRFNLQLLQRIPHDLEYVTPQEILILLRLCNAYGVDWTVGLQATTAKPARVFAYRERKLMGDEVAWKPVRVRRERLLQDARGVLVPDGDIAWAQQLLGILHAAIDDALELGRL